MKLKKHTFNKAIHAFTIHVTVLVLLKGVLYARSSRLIPDKANLGFRFPCDGPGRGGTCQVSAWDHIFLGLFWMYNSLSIVIFHFSWKMQSDVWGTVNASGISHITGGNFAQSANTINGWLRDYLWAQSAQVLQSYGSALSAYGLMFLGAHFVWAGFWPVRLTMRSSFYWVKCKKVDGFFFLNHPEKRLFAAKL